MVLTMNQEMTDVPEYRQVQNAPSKNGMEQAYANGYKQGFKEGNINGLKHALAQMDVIIHALTQTIKSVEIMNV